MLGLSLWIVDVASAQARRVPGLALNGIFGQPCEWLGDSQRLICKAVPKGRGTPPARSEVPTGPVIQENLGRVTPVANLSGLAEEPRGRGDFRLLRNVAGSGGWTRWQDHACGQARCDGKRIGISRRAICAARRAPSSVFLSAAFRDVPRKNLGGRSKEREQQATGRQATRRHDSEYSRCSGGGTPRISNGGATRRSTVFWVEAADGGDPRVEAPVRDRLFMRDAPFEVIAKEAGGNSLCASEAWSGETAGLRLWRRNGGRIASGSCLRCRQRIQGRK